MKTRNLTPSDNPEVVIAESRQRLQDNPDDMGAIARIARAFCVKGDYQEAIVRFERLAAHHSEDKIANTLAPGSPAYQIDIASLHWLMGDHATAISKMHGLVAGILDGSIKYGDAAGGIHQGLLLYYMGITSRNAEEVSYALKYLRNRVEKLRRILGEHSNTPWPCPVAQYLLGDIALEAVMERVNSQRHKLAVPDAEARIELGKRFRLLSALFYDGVKSRTNGGEAQFLVRMHECLGLEGTSSMLECYLARDEVKQSQRMK